VRDAVAIGILTCRGLEAAHAVGVVHCDLKPANLFLSRVGPVDDAEILGGFAGGLKILDFGIAKTTHDLADSPHAPGEFAIVGTPEYMAPEQAHTSAVDGRADVYALGCVIYELCTGRLPFVASSPVALSEMKSKSAPDPMRDRSRALGIPSELDRVVMKALAPKPEDRFANASDFRRALERIFESPRKRRAVARGVGYACIGAASLFALAAFAKPHRSSISAPPLAPLALEPTLVPQPLPFAIATATTTVPATTTTTTTATPNPTAVATTIRPTTATRAATGTPTPRTTSAPMTPVTPRSHLSQKTEKKLTPSDPTNALTAGAAALDNGSLIEALAIHRALAKEHPTDVRVLRGWAESAAAARDWSEAIEASESWAFADNTVEPRLYLARMLAYSGRRRAAVRILENVIEAHPESDESRALMRDYQGTEAPTSPSSARADHQAASSQLVQMPDSPPR
jgi:serine/threonine-protein kinase